MALQFDRNVNLEEIDSDALFGIQYLLHQTLAQKIIFWGGAITATAGFIFTQAVWHLPFFVSFSIALIFGGLGFMFGGNQSENLTIASYLKLLFFKPMKYVNYESTEDITIMKKEADIIKAEDEKKNKTVEAATPEGQRRMLLTVILLVGGTLLMFIILMGISSYKKNNNQHHTVSYYSECAEI